MAVASMNPDNMTAGGLVDDIDGVITKVRFLPWNYGGSIEFYVLGVAVDITPDPASHEKPFTQWYSAGDLEQFVPSMDGENPAPGLEHYGEEGNDDESAAGIYAMQVGKKDQLSNSSNWAQFIIAALESGFPREKLDASVASFEGVSAHFNRVPQKKRAGLVKAAPVAGEKKRDDTILVITEFKGFVNAQGSGPKKGPALKTGPATSAKTSAPTPATSAPTSAAAGGLDDKLVAIVRAALVGQAEGINKGKLPAAALKGLAAAEKGKGVKRIVEAEFLGGHEEVWAYDPESGTLISLEG